MIKLLQSVLLAAAMLAAVAAAAGAQDDPDTLSVAELEGLVATLEDETERAKLVTQLKALIEARREQAAGEATQPSLGEVLLERLAAHGGLLGDQLSALTLAVAGIPDGLRRVADVLRDPEARGLWIGVATALAIALAAAFVAGWLIRMLLARPRAAVAVQGGEDWLLQALLLTVRLVLALMPPIAFAVSGWAAAVAVAPDAAVRAATLAVVYAIAITAAISGTARSLLMPDGGPAPGLGEETAAYLFHWIRRIAGLLVYGYFAIQIAGLLGLGGAVRAALLSVLGLAFTLLLVMLILQNRKPVAELIAGDGSGRLRLFRRRFADLWHVLAILYVSAAFLVWQVGAPGGFTYILSASVLSVVAVAIAVVAQSSLRRLLRRAFALREETRQRLPGLEARVNRYLPVIEGVLRTIVWIVAGLFALQAWGVDLLLWLSEAEGRALLSRLAGLATIVLLAVVAWEVLNASIERYLASHDGSQSQRARTLLPLFRKAVLAVLVVIVGLTLLSELGINIAPLLAGAGVLGLAVGFGAQTLVRDIITGLFILIEDTISVGDFVTLGSHGGTVEAMSIRSIRLRDPSGIVHTVPFSDVTTVINATREFAFSVMDIGVAYKEDVDRVMGIAREVGAALREDPEWSAAILDDIEVLGLDRFDDSAVVIKARLRTQPGKQWAVRRAFNRLLKIRFDEEGIEIPFPQRTVWFAEQDGETPAARKASAPAASAERPSTAEKTGAD